MTEELYTFSSRPRVVESGLKHKKPPHERTQFSYGNITYDRPVVRGNTYAQHINPTTAQLDTVEIQRQQAIRKKAIARKQTREQFRSRTPEAVAGRKHIDVQTDLYLEELSDIIVTKDVACVTDAFLDKPATPLFIPAKSGKDAETQIEEGDLFDFDREVQPILEVLVGKTIEQALLEVMEEEELACLKAQQRAYRELRNNELAEVQRLQEQKNRQDEEKKRRIAQQREQLKIQRETAEKIAVRAFTQEYLSGLVPAVFTSLRTQGYFNDPVETDIKTNFFPWLMDEVHKKMEEREIARQVLDTIIHDVVKKRMEKMKELETKSNESES